MINSRFIRYTSYNYTSYNYIFLYIYILITSSGDVMEDIIKLKANYLGDGQHKINCPSCGNNRKKRI